MEINELSGIPALDDTEGFANYMAQQTAQEMMPQQQAPAILQPQTQAAQEPAEPTPAQPATQTPPATYTSEQVQQIVQQALAQRAQAAQTQPQANAQPQTSAPRQQYSAQQQAIIAELVRRGTPLEVIANAMKGNNAQQNAALEQRLTQMEDYLRSQQYAAEEAAFIEKMNTFGSKFGLSENDLVVFGNKALENGINLTQVKDVEPIFRALYPEQYAVRSRIASAGAGATSQIYGGASAGETPRAAADKAADAYAEEFLRTRMPNQWYMNQKK